MQTEETEAPQLETMSFFQEGWAANPFDITTEEFVPEASEPHREISRAGRFGPRPEYIDELWDQSDLDWHAIRALVSATANELSRTGNSGASNDEREKERSQAVINDQVSRWVGELMNAGEPAPDEATQVRIRKAIYDSLFGLGRIQPLIESKYIENIEIQGCDVVHIELKDGSLCDGPAVAETDDQLINDLQFWASRSSQGRPFARATPTLNLELGKRARLAAMAWVTKRPIVTIRLHGLVEVTFDDLIERETITPLMKNFLTSVVRSGDSIVVSGAQGAGKTTLCRALCGALPPSERIITFETDRELHLEEMPDKHPRVFGVEARPGSGEFREDGKEAGKFEIIDALRESLRHNGDRLLVGEVRGGEIIAMIQAMQSGTGSISTTHARSARDTYNKLVTCCLEVDGISEAYANRAIVSAINYVAFIKKVLIQEPGKPARRVRRVTEVLAMTLTADGPSFTDVFKPDEQGIARAVNKPPFFDDLVEAGLDEQAFVQEINTYGAQR